MTFEDLLEQSILLIQRLGRISYRALKRQFDLDDDCLEDLVFELTQIQKVAVDQDKIMLLWVDPAADLPTPDLPTPGLPDPQSSRLAELKPHRPPPNTETTNSKSNPADAERRQLTVMFCDLVNSTELSEQFDPEDLREIFMAYQDVSAKVIALFGGYIAKYLGDGILIYFGYPQAHEDDAQRAVRGGLGILEAIARLNPRIEEKWGVKLSMRLGIHTGLVVAGDMGCKNARDPLAIVGDTPNISARLQGVAAPDTLIISESTYRLIEGFFDCQYLGEFDLKGISKPISAYQVVHESTAKSRLDVAEQQGLMPLVGREKELKRLQDYWEQAKSGQSHVVLLRAEAGLGKSRLLWALKEHVSIEPNAWLSEFRCSPYYRHSAFYPIVTQLEDVILQFGQEDGPTEKLTKIEGFFSQYGLPLPLGVPLIASLLSVPFQAKYQPLHQTPERQKQQTLELLVQVILLRATEQPVLLVVEDLHWVDDSTLNLLTHLISKGADHSIFILLTARNEFNPPWNDASRITSIVLLPFTPKQARTMIGHMLGSKSLPTIVADQIVAKTDGMPLFIEELTKTVLESDILQEENGRYELLGPLPSFAIPATLHDSLIARLDRLFSVKEVAQLCSTLGREFDYKLLKEIFPWNQAALQNGLSQLVEANLLYQEGVPPSATYQFKHALIQDAAYQSLLKGRRQFYHQRIAETLEQRMHDWVLSQPALLAHHFTEAGLSAKAVEYWLKAGQKALQQSANSDAIAHFLKGIELLEDCPDEHRRDQWELQMQLGLAPAFMAINGWAATEVEQACIKARNLSEKSGDDQHLCAALWGLWTNYLLRGQMDPAKETAMKVSQLAIRSQQPMLSIIAGHAVGYTCHYRGEFIEAKAHGEKALALHSLELERSIVLTFQFSSTVAIHLFMARSLWMLGYSEQSPVHIEKAMILAEELNHTPSTAYALAAGCFYYHYLWDAEWIQEKSAQLIEISLNEGFLLWYPVAMIFHGWSLAAQGNLSGGIVEMTQGIELYCKTGSAIIYPHIMVMLAEALIKAGQLTDALKALNNGMRQATDRNEHNMEPELYRLKAEILIQLSKKVDCENRSGLLKQAEDSYIVASELAKTQSARILELRTTIGLSRLRQSQGKVQEAYSLLLRIYNQFTEGLSSQDLRAARTILDELELLQ